MCTYAFVAVAVDCCRLKIKEGRFAYNIRMYEITISAPDSQRLLLANVVNSAQPALCEMDGISAEVREGTRLFFSAAVSDTFRFQLKRLLCDSLCDSIVLGYKNAYIRDCLKVGEGTFLQNVLIGVMCLFDKNYDRQFVCRVLDLEQPVYIDGYCNFRLNGIKQKWREVAQLVTDNRQVLYDGGLIAEFLQYVTDTVCSRARSMCITFQKGDFLLFDGGGALLPSEKTLSPRCDAEVEAAVNLLMYKPKKLSVYSDEEVSADFKKVADMFDTRYLCGEA